MFVKCIHPGIIWHLRDLNNLEISNLFRISVCVNWNPLNVSVKEYTALSLSFNSSIQLVDDNCLTHNMTVHESRALRICQRLNYVYNICMSKVILRSSVMSISQKNTNSWNCICIFHYYEIKTTHKKENRAFN